MADLLLPLTRVGRGGRCSVRGSRENQLVWANALIASLASRIPLRRPRRWADCIQIMPFADGGHGWNHPSTTADPTPLARVGLGARGAGLLRYRRAAAPAMGGGLGRPTQKHADRGGHLQDKGIHLQWVLMAFEGG